MRRQHRADDEVLLHAGDRRLDELRFVAHDAQRVAGRQRRLQIGQALLDVVGDFHRVGARLLADLEQHRGHAVHAGLGGRLGHAVFHPRHVAQAHGMPGHFAQHHVAEGVHRLEAAARAQRHRLRALIEASAGHVGVLRRQRPRHVVDRQPLRAQQRGVEPHVDLALAAADDQHLADAVGALEPPAQHLVGELGDVAHGLVGGDGHGDDRRRRRVELLDRGLQRRARQQRQDAVDAVAHFLRGDVGVLVEHERHDDLRDAFGRGRAQRVDGADGVDGFFDLVGDLGLDLLGRRAGQPRGHDDGRDVDVGKAVDAEAAEGEEPDDGQREHEHPGEDRAPDAEFGEPLHD